MVENEWGVDSGRPPGPWAGFSATGKSRGCSQENVVELRGPAVRKEVKAKALHTLPGGRADEGAQVIGHWVLGQACAWRVGNSPVLLFKAGSRGPAAGSRAGSTLERSRGPGSRPGRSRLWLVVEVVACGDSLIAYWRSRFSVLAIGGWCGWWSGVGPGERCSR